MFLVGGRLGWSASDLAAAAQCEFATLRRADVLLGWAEPIEVPADPLLDYVARLGDEHEAEILDRWRSQAHVVEVERAPVPYTDTDLAALQERTAAAFAGPADVVYQAGFFDGDFLGYADFVERTADGWVVCDAKLARQAKPHALLQLGAYADQLRRLGMPVAPRVSLLLGSGERADFPADDVLPVFRERRARLRHVLAEHRAGWAPVEWGDDRYAACGRCAECEHAATAHDDLVLVAGMRSDQRRRLRAAGITTVEQLATAPPDALRGLPATYERLREQARMQWRQTSAGPGAPVAYELTASAAETLALLPAPSPGDLFFDFEGDPLYDEGDPSTAGLEYLWGVLDAGGAFTPLWADTRDEERATFERFVDDLAARRAVHPDLHVYHYAPYETTALKRLAARYQTREHELDDLLRSEVFVDLYATVRRAIRVSAPSYSIKKVEPLYGMTHEGDVKTADVSIAAYHEYRARRGVDPARAAAVRATIVDYNHDDCVSTLRLRDWLLERAAEAGVRDRVVPRALDVTSGEPADADPVFLALMARSGPADRAHRTPEQQAFAMLATGIDYYRREAKSFWWAHYERLGTDVSQWGSTRDVFVVARAEVVSPWAVPSPKSRNPRRVVRLVGDWGPGSKPTDRCRPVYARELPPGVDGPVGAPYGAGADATVELDPTDPRVVLLTESRPPSDTFDDLPVALVPSSPPNPGAIADAIRDAAALAVAPDALPVDAASHALPAGAAYDVLARRTPRLRPGAELPDTGDPVRDVVGALLALDGSYLAVQGPPGAGKTYTGSRVVAELVAKHGWRVGVVAQSHAVVENMLASVVGAGLDPALVGKSENRASSPTWTELAKAVDARVAFVADHAATGCVLGGTAWTFASPKLDPGTLDLLVIDEAGQFALAPTLGVARSARRLLLLGDPQQLPQVSQGEHAEPVDMSALGWLTEGHDTLPADRGSFLATTYRMHPALCAKVSRLSYDGRLHAAPAASRRHLEGVPPGLGVVLVDHEGNRTESAEEADAVVEQVRAHLGLAWTADGVTRPLDEHDILVVAPYNAQVERVRTALRRAGYPDVRVGTVDLFQGQEAAVAIVSMAASSHGDVPRGMGFLLDRHRINVAVSRARWRAVIVRSRALTAFMPTTVDGLLGLGAFVGLCEGAAEDHPGTTQG